MRFIVSSCVLRLLKRCTLCSCDGSSQLIIMGPPVKAYKLLGLAEHTTASARQVGLCRAVTAPAFHSREDGSGSRFGARECRGHGNGITESTATAARLPNLKVQ